MSEDVVAPGSGDETFDETVDETFDETVGNAVVEVLDEADDVLLLEEVVESLELPVWEPTGEPGVDEALDELTRLDPDDVHQHAAVFDGIHQRLRGTLSDLDTSA